MSQPKPPTDRFDRQKMIPGWDQAKLKRSRVFIAGMGALGNECAKNLVLAGVGALILLDFDRVEYTNLNRMILFSDGDVGSYKVTAAKKAIARLSRFTRVIVLNKLLQDVLGKDPGALRGINLIVGCLDNREARFLLNHFSVAHRIPYVDGGMLNAMASVRVSIPPYTPCLECGVPQSTYSQIGQRYRCEDIVFEDMTAKQMAIRHPTISTVTSVAAAIQSHEALKILLGLERFRLHGEWTDGLGKPIENEIQYDCRTNSFLAQAFHRDVGCYVCGTRGQSIDPVKPGIVRVSTGQTLSDLFSEVRLLLGTDEFNLTRGLRPFPDRMGVISEIRNLIQRLSHLSRLLARPALSSPTLQEPYRILRGYVESTELKQTQNSLRRGIPFQTNDLQGTVQATRTITDSFRPDAHHSSDLAQTLNEIDDMAVQILKHLSNNLTLAECQLADADVLCAVRHDRNRLHDRAVEVVLRQPQ